MVKKKKSAKVKQHIDEPDDDLDDEQDWVENHDADEPEAGLQAVAQEVTQALVAAAGHGLRTQRHHHSVEWRCPQSRRP